MTGSQAQRGMYMNYGTKDVGRYEHNHKNIDHMFVGEKFETQSERDASAKEQK